ncbi:hypothetical protein ACJX0J_004525 [Zea mays]
MTATIFSILRIPILFEKKSKEKKKERVNNKTGYSFFFLQFFFLEILEKFSFKTDSCFTEEKREVLDKLTISRLFHINGSTFMFLLHEYDIFWTFLIIASLIPILVFWISGLLAPVSEGPEKLSSYESGIEPMGGAWLQFRIRYYMFALVFVVFDVFDVLGVSVFIEAFIFTLNTDSYSTVRGVENELGGVLLCRKRKKRAVQSFKLAFEIDQDNAAGLTLQIKAGDWDSIAVILYVYGYNYLRSQCAYDSLPKRIILESRLFSGDNKFMFTYTTQFQILFKASFLFSNLENHIFFLPRTLIKKNIFFGIACLEIYLLTLEIYLLTLD